MRKLASGSVLAAAALLASGCAAGGGGQADRACDGPGTGGPRVVYRTEPTPDAPRVTRAAVEGTIDVMCRRARALDSSGARIRALRGNRIGVRLGPGRDATRTADALGIPARLAFYDWDANVIGNPDRPLPDLERAVRRAAAAEPRAEPEDLPPTGPEQSTVDRYGGDQNRLRRFYDRRNDAVGATYYAGLRGRVIAGPETSCAGLAAALAPARPPVGGSSAGDLDAAACGRRIAGRGLPPGATVHVVPRGIRVVAAARPGGGDAGGDGNGQGGAAPERPAGYYVIEDDAGVLPAAIESAEERTDEKTGASSAQVGFTADGATAFRALTQSIAERAADDPGAGDPRLAVALDNELVSLAAIDPAASPAGLDPDGGALVGDLGGADRARLLAKLLDSGALPLNVRPAP